MAHPLPLSGMKRKGGVMAPNRSRWALPGLDEAVARCRRRNRQGIRCILHPLGEDATSEAAADRSLAASRSCLRAIAGSSLDASVSLKLTALGALIDPDRCGERVAAICGEAAGSGIRCEFDMEGRSLVDATLAAARGCGAAPVVALQAYLDRTPGDLGEAVGAGVGVRIVKGAYLGDTEDFLAIEERFRALCAWCAGRGVSFGMGTHDPALVAWAAERLSGSRDAVEFGFLMGLADETKVRMAGEGWRVAEYIPFGEGRAAYVWRRQRYLDALAQMGRSPLL